MDTSIHVCLYVALLCCPARYSQLFIPVRLPPCTSARSCQVGRGCGSRGAPDHEHHGGCDHSAVRDGFSRSGAVEALDLVHDGGHRDGIAYEGRPRGPGALERLQHARVVQQQLRQRRLQHLPPGRGAPEVPLRVPARAMAASTQLLLRQLHCLPQPRHARNKPRQCLSCCALTACDPVLL